MQKIATNVSEVDASASERVQKIAEATNAKITANGHEKEIDEESVRTKKDQTFFIYPPNIERNEEVADEAAMQSSSHSDASDYVEDNWSDVEESGNQQISREAQVLVSFFSI